MRFKIIGSTVLAAFAFGLATPANATVWDFAQDLNDNTIPQDGNGANGAWRYFFADTGDKDGVYSLFPNAISDGTSLGYTTTGFHFVLGTGTGVPGGNPSDGALHPGGTTLSDVIVGWTAPTDGTYSVTGRFEHQDPGQFGNSGSGINASITTTTTPGVPNSDVAIPDFTPAFLDKGGTLPFIANFDFNFTAVANQSLFFRIDANGNSLNDFTFLNAIIEDVVDDSGDGTKVSEPGILSLFAVGLVGLGWLRRRREAS